MRHRVIKDQGRTVLAAAVGAVLATFAGTAGAIEFEFGDGWSGDWNTTAQVSSSWRAEDNDPKLVTPGDAALIGISGVAGNGAVGGNLNWGKGDRFSTPFKIISDIEIKKGSFGLLVRGKAWYDDALENRKVRYGNQANGYNGFTMANYLAGGPHPIAELSDQGFEREQRFSGAMLLDAYVYDSFAVGNTDLQVRLGNQVINWGESIFIQGVNQFNPIDAVAARKPGAEVKEALLPVWAAYFNWGLGGGASLEAFYQFKWQNTSIEGCGMYWAQTENNISSSAGACTMATSIIPGTTSVNPVARATGLYAPLIDGKDAKDSGQYGLAFRFPVEKLDTEFGLYFEKIHSRTPIVSGMAGTRPVAPIVLPNGTLVALPASAATGGLPAWFIPGTNTTLRSPAAIHSMLVPGVQSAQAYWEYPEDIKIFGLSAATNLFSWSVSAEASYTQDLPVQVNGNDMFFAMLLGIGPAGSRGTSAILGGANTYVPGYDRFNKTQFQVNTVKVYSNVLGSTTAQLVSEVGFQWNNVPEYKSGGLRYGRGFMFGWASNPTLAVTGVPGGSTCIPGTPITNPTPNGCQNEGFVTDFSWGYRLRWQMEYSNVANSGIAVIPSIYWAHDVSGVSPDPTFIADRQQLGLGLRFNYNKRYNLELNYVQYNEGSKYDPLSDRDFYSAALNMTF